MNKRGIRILPGSDYGFAWIPHGTNAKDLRYFTVMIGITPMNALLSATREGGNPLEGIRELQDKEKVLAVRKDGEFYKKLI